MKLVTLLSSIVVLWCLLGSIVLGPGILAYPAAWCAVAAVMYGVHRFLGLGQDNLESLSLSDSSSADKSPASGNSHNHPTALAR
ncbi:hypothetical protein DTL21_20630 [Bremerella cremea]|uniref:Uncharacterized protein n=1 Tax=Blastopirellula marina TaxID=124 RepID=A0A2S8FKB6_9BACT|nr:MULTISPECIES: hypothetical protein [Pirellulaceae]PQO32612.1 hypothetical protein C5Y83_20610 [Blastopirellula marina]RCS45679.1 hypothetical protein DTL21_20630 [Bremerella cremea]